MRMPVLFFVSEPRVSADAGNWMIVTLFAPIVKVSLQPRCGKLITPPVFCLEVIIATIVFEFMSRCSINPNQKRLPSLLWPNAKCCIRRAKRKKITMFVCFNIFSFRVNLWILRNWLGYKGRQKWFSFGLNSEYSEKYLSICVHAYVQGDENVNLLLDCSLWTKGPWKLPPPFSLVSYDFSSPASSSVTALAAKDLSNQNINPKLQTSSSRGAIGQSLSGR